LLSQDKEKLRALLKIQHHFGVSPEVLRELNHGHARGTAAQKQKMLPVHAKIGNSGGEDAFNMAPMLIDE
jgi:Zn-dependent peptidase ImmA (M78 family)